MSDELLKPVEQLSKEKRELLEMLMKEDSTGVQAIYVAPRTIVEESLATIWSQALGIKQVGIHDNFLELGGDSIQSIQVVAKAHQLGLQLSTSQLFEYPTIAELATVVDTIQVLQAQQEPVSGSIPLTPIQRWFFGNRSQDSRTLPRKIGT
ncbi:MAG: phosphopantetheine-binding protein [Rhizonema sp. PD38]|nr:phosphopantetheine-binding protein [Rhizonema sp. PD38]